MPRYNVYRLYKPTQKSLEEKLTSVGLSLENIVKNENYTFKFYFSRNPDRKDVPWIELYKDYFISDTNGCKNLSYFGIMLIFNERVLYAVSLGKSHFYLQDYCHLDFGIDIGLRVLNQKSVQTKNSKLFGGKKKKSLIVYKTDTEIDVDSGESVVYLKGKTINAEVWGKSLTCGNSALFSIKEFEPRELSSLIDRIEKVLTQEPLFEIPRAELIKDETSIKSLNTNLVEMIKTLGTNLEVEEQSLSGVDFIFAKDYSLSLRTEHVGWKDVPEQTIESIRETLNMEGDEISISNIDQIKIKAKPDEGNGFTKSLKYFLDYVDEDFNFLQNGKWYRFNEKYIDYLLKEINKIPIETFDDFVYSKSEYTSFFESLSEEEKKKWYAERFFNERKASHNGYLNLDRDSTMQIYNSYSLEVADLYKDDTLFFVKIGGTQKQNYVIDQAIGTLKYLLDNQRKIFFNGESYIPKKLCLWLVLDRKTRIDSLKKLKSFILLINLLDWKKETLLSEFEPKIRISYVQE
jgi:uncharacterized protein (TIGR04141 family)